MFGPVLESYSKRITTGAYAPPLDTTPGFAAALACKDMRHALSIAAGHGTRFPTVELALGRLNLARVEAGLAFWSGNSRQG